MRHFKKLTTVLLIVALLIVSALTACSQVGDDNGVKPDDPNQYNDPSQNVGEVDEFEYRADYNPTTFDKSKGSYELTKITEGVVLVKNTVVKNNGHESVVYAVEIDLTKVSIAAGSKDNTTDLGQLTKTIPANQANAFETATGKTVYAYLNADFFGSKPVNAFVKDGVIVKDSHNDNSVYDYTNMTSDVPASAPMLFGVKGTTAQVAPMIAYDGDIMSADVKASVVKAKLTYKIAVLGNENGCDVEMEKDSVKDGIVFNTTEKTCKAGDYALKVTAAGGFSRMRVVEVTQCQSDTVFTPDKNYSYVFVGENHDKRIEFSMSKNKNLSIYVTSPDDTWKGYTTILGCRQALVMNGSVPGTVAKENTNGAQTPDVPRSAVGVKEDGKVVIFAVESLYYGKKAAAGDTHGMNLPELADFMAYYGIKDGANFDGGGSTQLTALIDGQKKVLVRSSDTGKATLNDTRAVINTILVVEK